ncbi:enoyl-CoA hydratase family protein [Streptomyces sp. NPDC051218]|uniref:enoyl-CoA hydratase family protein n=1 Tax=Streptomyces sp. NPDC051218 TaxID=3365645 RepID=UPI0037A16DB9
MPGDWSAPVTTLVRCETRDQVATLTLDSPYNRNALSTALVAQLRECLRDAAEDADVRAVVLRHTGRVFCAGADLSEAGSGSFAQGTQAIMEMLTAIVELDKPVLARVTGHVRAGGMGIVGACDLALATDSASFAFTEARLGVAPAIISLTTLDQLDPRAASRYYLTGAIFDAAVAADIGLITQAVTGDELDATLDALLTEIRATSPQGAAETKRLLTAARRERMAAQGRDLVDLSARLFASEEAQEGIHAFLERREPAWRK